MGYTKDGRITNFTPDDTDQEFYIEATCQDIDLLEILTQAREKWGQHLQYGDLRVRPEKIHTRCIYYDLHDPSDWDDYLVISLN